MECGWSTDPVPAAPADPLRSQLEQATAGEYRIMSELGRGGMAAVFLAEDLALGRRVAIKVMLTGAGTAVTAADRFLLEARTAAQLSHPNIIPIYAVRTAGELRYFVMKYLAGQALDRLVRTTGPLPIPLVLSVLGQVGAALEHAHTRGVVHRDIKPANIVVDEDGSAIVADFGIAKVAQGASLTQAGTTVGTPSYMSPEQCTGRPVTGASDQYALGCVAFELLTGRPPFVHEEVVPVFMAHVSDPPPPLVPLRPDCPIALAEAIARMLAKGPDDRWPSLEAAIQAAGAAGPAIDPTVRARLRELAGPFDLEPWVPTPVQVTAAPTAPSFPALLPASPPPPPAPPPVPLPVVVAVEEPAPVIQAYPIELVPGGGILSVGQHLQLIGRTRGALSRVEPIWSSSDHDVLRVSPEGEVVAVRPGSAHIIGQAGGETARAGFQVTRVEATTVRILPQLQALGLGEEVPLQAVVADRLGVVLQDRVISWRSDNLQVVVIEADGVLRAVGVGRARVVASCGTGTTALELRVTAPNVAAVRIDPQAVVLQSGESMLLRVEVEGSRGRAMRGVPVQWQTSDPAIAAIDPDGTVHGRRFGTARIAAIAGGRRATVPVEVTGISTATISGPRLRIGG